MTAPDAFARALQIAECFERAEVPYAIGEAIALGIWGVPRGTVDVDVNVFVEDDRVRAVATLLRSLGISIDDETAVAQSAARGMFVGAWDGMRVDVFTPSIAFSHEALRTRMRKRAMGADAWYLSAEAVAVFKLLPSPLAKSDPPLLSKTDPAHDRDHELIVSAQRSVRGRSTSAARA